MKVSKQVKLVSDQSLHLTATNLVLEILSLLGC